jgi:dTMP kinase
MGLLAEVGHIIGVEGIDAAGKQTQSSLLEGWLMKKGFKTASLSFPDYETRIGKEIRAFLSGKRDYLPQLQHMLFAANRWEKAPLISKYRSTKDVIIVNRYSESNIVYGAANGLSIEWLMGLEEGLPKADLVIVLDANPAGLLHSRRPGPPGDSYERSSKLQEEVQKLYRKLAPQFGWKVVDASKDIDSVHADVIRVIEENTTLGTGGRGEQQRR